MNGKHVSYALTLPRPLEAGQVITWLETLSGGLRSGLPRLFGYVPTVGFELWATPGKFEHRLVLPAGLADYAVNELRVLVPGVHVEPDKTVSKVTFTHAAEFRRTHPDLPLGIEDPASASARLLASMQLRAKEALVFQVLLAPTAFRERPPLERTAGTGELGGRRFFGEDANKDELKARREQLETANFLGTIRVGVKASSDARAEQLISNAWRALASLDTAYTRIRRRRLVRRCALLRRIQQAKAPWLFGFQLSLDECAGILAWPVGSPAPQVAGLPQPRSRQLAASGSIAKKGRVLMRSTFPGDERPLAISHENSRLHTFVLGRTGYGKTTLLQNLCLSDVAAGRGTIVIEATGNLIEGVLQRIPPKRKKDVVILDVAEGASTPVSVNVLAQGNPQVVAANLRTLFNQLFGRSGVRFPESLYHGIVTLMTSRAAVEPMAFVDLVPLLAPRTPAEERFQDAMVKGVAHDDMLNAFWQRLLGQTRQRRDIFTEPLLDRIWELCARPEVANIIGQSTSTIDMSEVIEKKRILLVNLSGLGDDAASIVGSLVLKAIWDAVVARPTDPEDTTSLFLDEFENFLYLPGISAEVMLAQARKYSLALHLATQRLGGLPPPMLSAILANCATTICFKTSALDGRVMAREYGPLVREEDFVGLAKHQVLACIACDGGVSPPVTGRTLLPSPPTGLADEIRQLSRRTYGRPIAQVKQQIQRRREDAVRFMNQKESTSRRAKLGDEAWEG